MVRHPARLQRPAHTIPHRCPVGHLAPPQPRCTWLSGLPIQGTNRLHVSSITHTHTHHTPPNPQVQAWPCYPAFSSSPSLAAEACSGCKYKGRKFSDSHLYYLHTSPSPPSSSSLSQRLSARPTAAIHHPKAAPALPDGSGSRVPASAHSQHPAPRLHPGRPPPSS